MFGCMTELGKGILIAIKLLRGSDSNVFSMIRHLCIVRK